MLSPVERIAAITAQIALSVIVWFAASEKKSRIQFLLLAIVLHAILDAASVLAAKSGMPIIGVEIMIYILAIAFVVLGRVIWKKMIFCSEDAKLLANAYPVRRLNVDEIQSALDLTWEVFLQFEAPEYSKEGIDFFRESLDDEERTRALKFYGAFDGDQLVGTLCMREPQHIGGFFVKADHHRQGIGRALFETMRRDYDKQEFTVNSSPYAVKVYEHLGFQATDKEQVVNGLRFTPMIYK